MKLAVVSHKPCWRKGDSPSGYATDGGFPFQIEAISELFDETKLLVPIVKTETPKIASSIKGYNLTVMPLDNPAGRLWKRKLALVPWSLKNIPLIWKIIRDADAVHTPLAGDIGTIGAVIALMQKKPLFVRYCGRWGYAPRFTKRMLFKFLEKIAGGKNVVLATGGDDKPPSMKNQHIKWIFSTSLRENEISSLPARQSWKQGDKLRLITAARQEPGKYSDKVIKALQIIAGTYENIEFHVVGDGSNIPALKKLSIDLCLDDKIIFRGYLRHDAVMGALCESHIFCFPTKTEGFPKAVMEALSCGLPVITSPVSVLPNLIGDMNGILLKDDRPETIAEAVIRLIDDPKLFRDMQLNAQQTAKSYTLENWRDTIGGHLSKSWDQLKSDSEQSQDGD